MQDAEGKNEAEKIRCNENNKNPNLIKYVGTARRQSKNWNWPHQEGQKNGLKNSILSPDFFESTFS